MKMTVRNKILSGFALALAALLIVGATGYQSTHQLLSAADARRQAYDVLLGIQHLLSSLKDAETGQRGFLLTGEDRYLEPYTAGTKAIGEEVKTLRDLTRDNSTQQSRLTALDPLIAGKLAELNETIELRRAKGLDAALQVVVSDRGKRFMDEIRDITGQLQSDEETRLSQLTQELQERVRFASTVIIGATLASLALLLLAGFYIASNIAVPLAEMTSAAERIAGGELDVRVAAHDGRQDEVAALGGAFSQMTRNLREMAAAAKRIARGDLTTEVKPQSDTDDLGSSFALMMKNLRAMMQEITEAVNVLSASSAEILVSSSQLAASAAESASAITETTTTVEEVKQTAQVSSEKGRYVADSAQQSALVSKKGKQSVEQSVTGMNRIRAQMDSIGASMVRLNEQTQAIGEIIATVNDLAEQSNVLAVNASIEAAKAGEHGKGFSIVAQEVRTLAEQSKQATAQVRTILSDIQKATAAAMLATEQGSKAVDTGLQQSADAGQSIAALSDSISQSAQAATQIAASSQQQLVGMDQVVIAIRNIQESSTQNATAVKQVENAARDLNNLGQKLKDLVKTYKV
jgi:methyl-accepting chemotaxis protein